jgi:hypothetical protein
MNSDLQRIKTLEAELAAMRVQGKQNATSRLAELVREIKEKVAEATELAKTFELPFSMNMESYMPEDADYDYWQSSSMYC